MDQAQTGKGKRLRRRVFLSYEGMKTLYPILEEKRWMTSVFQVVRWFSVMTDGRLGKAVNELRISQKHSNAQISDTRQFLEEAGLDFS